MTGRVSPSVALTFSIDEATGFVASSPARASLRSGVSSPVAASIEKMSVGAAGVETVRPKRVPSSEKRELSIAPERRLHLRDQRERLGVEDADLAPVACVDANRQPISARRHLDARHVRRRRVVLLVLARDGTGGRVERVEELPVGAVVGRHEDSLAVGGVAGVVHARLALLGRVDAARVARREVDIEDDQVARRDPTHDERVPAVRGHVGRGRGRGVHVDNLRRPPSQALHGEL